MSRVLAFAAAVVSAAALLSCAPKHLQQPGQQPEQTVQQPVFESGIYSWDEISPYFSDVKKMGTRIIRIGGQNTLTDSLWGALLNGDFDVLYCADEVADISTYRTDQDYISDYLAFVDKILTRYGPDGTFWDDNPNAPRVPLRNLSIRNEPMSYGSGTYAQKADLYAKLLPAAYKHIKARWPTVTVVGFDASDSSSAAPDFISQVFQSNIESAYAFDVLAIHPYTAGQPPDGTITEDWGSWTVAGNVHILREIMRQYGLTPKPIWFTEIGYQIGQSDGGRYPVTGGLSLTLQAAYNIRMDMLAASIGVPRIYHMFVTDADNFNAGYFQSVSNPRPVAVATQIMNKYLHDATAIKIVLNGSLNTFYYLFTTPHGKVGVAWASTPETTTLQLEWPTAKVVDLFGKVQSITESTSVLLHLTESPVFLIESSR